jgi:integral membrane sensor domain MASE1
MKKLINNARTYIFLLYVLFASLSFFIKGNVMNTILLTIVVIVFFCVGNIGKENRDLLAKSIGGGGIPRPTKPTDENVGG